MPANPGSVLYCCTHNTLRSPIAEGLTKLLFGTAIYVDSVGVRAGTLDPFAAAVMDEIGVDISGHVAKTFDDLEETTFDLIVSLSPEAQHKAVELTREAATVVDFWNTFDPSLVEGNRDSRLAAYRAVRDGLDERIRHRFQRRGVPL